jgi:hypothetical protein
MTRFDASEDGSRMRPGTAQDPLDRKDSPERLSGRHAALASHCDARTEGIVAQALCVPNASLAPTGPRSAGANPHANAGRLLRDLDLREFREHGVQVLSRAR